jgi:MSHA biogenesis protein MshO
MNKQQRGFTLIELIIVMVVTAIVVLMISAIINRPLTSYFDTQRRADLAERAQSAINRMTIELEAPLPYSLRVSTSGRTLEFMPIVGVGRYRDGSAGNENELGVRNPDDAFNHLGDMVDSVSAGRLAINNTSATTLYNQAFANTDVGVITASGNDVDISDCFIDSTNDKNCVDGGSVIEVVDRITLDRQHRFDPSGSGSPSKRFYVVSDPVTYHCDIVAGTITRYQGYNISASIIEDTTTLSASTSVGLLASNVSDCNFSINLGGGSFSAPLVTLKLTLGTNDENTTLIKEVQQWNAP